MSKELDIYLAEPRGFCAGVVRAVNIVEETLKEFGAPIYVRHEIVHNKHVIADLKNKGVIFVNEIDEVEDTNRPVIFSAHGTGLDIAAKAKELNLKTIDAVCPLVKRVHNQIRKLNEIGAEIIIIGKKNHPEIIGTIGQLPKGKSFYIIDSIEQLQSLPINPDSIVGFVTQTTLSADDTKEIIEHLRAKFKNLHSLAGNDICYATTNRQKAVKELAKYVELIVILGSQNSSNSKQLKEVALKSGVKDAILIDDVSELDWSKVKSFSKIGISAGASAPEHLTQELLNQFATHYDKINIHECIICKEEINFKG